MMMKMFTVYDQKAEAYLQPFFANSKGVAIRMFAEAVNSQDHQFAKYPADFTLFEIGSFDDGTALTESFAPVNLGTALEHRTQLDMLEPHPSLDIEA